MIWWTSSSNNSSSLLSSKVKMACSMLWLDLSKLLIRFKLAKMDSQSIFLSTIIKRTKMSRAKRMVIWRTRMNSSKCLTKTWAKWMMKSKMKDKALLMRSLQSKKMERAKTNSNHLFNKSNKWWCKCKCKTIKVFKATSCLSKLQEVSVASLTISPLNKLLNFFKMLRTTLNLRTTMARIKDNCQRRSRFSSNKYCNKEYRFSSNKISCFNSNKWLEVCQCKTWDKARCKKLEWVIEFNPTKTSATS